MRIGLFCIMCACFLAVLTPVHSAQTAKTSDCSDALNSYSVLNANELINAFLSCAENEAHEDANVLLILGQVRAIADITILTPVDEENSIIVGELYSQLYYSFGGLGFVEIYRDPQIADRIAARVEDAALTYSSEYNPGWSYKSSSKVDIYDEIVDNAKSQRIWQLRNFALLMQNDAYYEAYLAHAELQKKNPVFEVGTPAYEESVRLNALMNDISSQIERLPEPEDTTPYTRLNEPDPDTEFRQIAFCFNGPPESSGEIFHSEQEVRDSWLSIAYSNSELSDLLSAIDFNDEILASYSFGKRMNASGAVFISELSYSETYKHYSLFARLGVVPSSCGVPYTESYPFVLGTVKKIPGGEIRSSGASNFPDDCGPIKSGFPSRTK